MYDDGGDYSSSSDVSESTESTSVATSDSTSETELYEASDTQTTTTGDATTELYSSEEASDADKEMYSKTEPSAQIEKTDAGKTVEENEAPLDDPKVETGTDAQAVEETQAGADNQAEAEAVRVEINENSPYSQEVNDHISSMDELEVYKEAGLKESTVDGRTCLIRDDIDLDYVDPKTGKTNRELMAKGRAPFDKATGEKLELHHIGQDYDSPLAELTADSQHGQHYSTLHTKTGESWRQDSQKDNHYNGVQRPNHWKARV